MLSAVAITKNEEANIKRYLDQLDFVEEIIIVDSYSTDRTVEIAKKEGARVIQRSFDNFAAQKNFALEQVKYDWVIFLDLDEFMSLELTQEILEALKNVGNFQAIKLKRNFYFMGRLLKYSGFQNDAVVRLFNKNKCTYKGLVHEVLEVNGKTLELKNSLDHYTYKSIDDYNRKQTDYCRLQAKQLFKDNLRPNLYHFLIRPLYRFLHQYFIRLGVLDGQEGFILAYLQGFSVFKRYLFLWTMYRNIE